MRQHEFCRKSARIQSVLQPTINDLGTRCSTKISANSVLFSFFSRNSVLFSRDVVGGWRKARSQWLRDGSEVAMESLRESIYTGCRRSVSLPKLMRIETAGRTPTGKGTRRQDEEAEPATRSQCRASTQPHAKPCPGPYPHVRGRRCQPAGRPHSSMGNVLPQRARAPLVGSPSRHAEPREIAAQALNRHRAETGRMATV